LSDKHELKVASVDTEPALDSKAWDAVPESIFCVHDDMPYANIATRMKLQRDKDHLYVRIESLHPHKHPEDFYTREPDKDTFMQEYVELAIAPPNAGGKVYRIAANPVEGSRYDALYTPGRRDRVEDKSWNGTWQYRFAVDGKKGPYSRPDRTSTAWFKIAFTDLGPAQPRRDMGLQRRPRTQRAESDLARRAVWSSDEGVGQGAVLRNLAK
jgi:hypothetical protein